jgi:hypothetical protein
VWAVFRKNKQPRVSRALGYGFLPNCPNTSSSVGQEQNSFRSTRSHPDMVIIRHFCVGEVHDFDISSLDAIHSLFFKYRIQQRTNSHSTHLPIHEDVLSIPQLPPDQRRVSPCFPMCQQLRCQRFPSIRFTLIHPFSTDSAPGYSSCPRTPTVVAFVG